MKYTADPLIITNPSERLLNIAREIRKRKQEQLQEMRLKQNSAINIVIWSLAYP